VYQIYTNLMIEYYKIIAKILIDQPSAYSLNIPTI